jgi:hypothetical protein
LQPLGRTLVFTDHDVGVAITVQIGDVEIVE